MISDPFMYDFVLHFNDVVVVLRILLFLSFIVYNHYTPLTLRYVATTPNLTILSETFW